MRQDDAAGKAYIVVYGLIKVIRTYPQAQMHTFRTSGTLTGDLSLVDRLPLHHTRVTLTECGLLQLDPVRFPQLTQEYPQLLLHMLRDIHAFVDAEDDYRNLLLHCTPQAKVTATLRYLAERLMPPLVDTPFDPYSLPWWQQAPFERELRVRRQDVSEALRLLRADGAIKGGWKQERALRFVSDPEGGLKTCLQLLRERLQRQL